MIDFVFIGIMLLFVILYFGIMIDLGLFDFFIVKMLLFVKGDLLKIVVGIVILMMIILLDGDGIMIYMIIIVVMLFLYKWFGMNCLVLVGIVMFGFGVMNIILWGGLMVRVLVFLKLDMLEVFMLLIFVMIVGIFWVIVVVYIFGKKEWKCFGVILIEYMLFFDLEVVLFKCFVF